MQVCSKPVNSNKILDFQFDKSTPVIEFVSGEDVLYRYFYKSNISGDIGYLWGMLINRKFYSSMVSVIQDAKPVLPQNYLNDVYCVPRFFLNTKDVVLLNKVYILHRISKYTDSRTIKPNALHYELALANKMNLDYYMQQKCSFAFNKQIIGFYLVILKIWYQAITGETDIEKRKKYVTLVRNYYDEYYTYSCE